MQRIDEGHREGATVDRAAMIARTGLSLADILLRHVGADFRAGDERGTRLLQNRRCVAHVIAMSVGQEHMRDPLRGAFPAPVPCGVAAQKWIDEDNSAFNLDPKRRMTIPGDFHQSVPRLFCRRRIRRATAMSKGTTDACAYN